LTNSLLSFGSVVLLAIAIIMVVATFRTRARVAEKYRTIAWSRQQIDRALILLSSTNIDDIQNGLQTVRALGIANEELLTRVGEFLNHNDRRVVEIAQDALLALSRRGLMMTSSQKEQRPPQSGSSLRP
jgi:hypothetical protein